MYPLISKHIYKYGSVYIVNKKHVICKKTSSFFNPYALSKFQYFFLFNKFSERYNKLYIDDRSHQLRSYELRAPLYRFQCLDVSATAGEGHANYVFDVLPSFRWEIGTAVISSVFTRGFCYILGGIWRILTGIYKGIKWRVILGEVFNIGHKIRL